MEDTSKKDYKPNIYPIMYWAVLYGALSALGLFAVYLLASFITVLWFPVFLAGLLWGGFRKYKQDKAVWMNANGVSNTPKSAVDEFKDAARDIAQASQEMVTRHAQEDADAVTAAQEAAGTTPQAQGKPFDEVQGKQAEQVAAQDDVVFSDSAPIITPQVPETPSQPTQEEKIITQEPEIK